MTNFIKKNECQIKETSMASAPLSADISLVSHCAHSLKIWKGPCVPSWQIKTSSGYQLVVLW